MTTTPVLARPSRWSAALRLQELGLVVVILLLTLFLTIQSGSAPRTLPAAQVKDAAGNVVKSFPLREVSENQFFNASNLVTNVLTNMSWMAVMAIGMTVVIISGGIDISVGSVMGLAALGAAATLQTMPASAGASAVLVGVAVPIGIGLGCGLVNGLLVVGLRMHPFIVTLATMSIFRWACERFVKGGSIPYGDRRLPAAFTNDFIAWQWKYPVYGGQLTQILQPVPLIVMLGALALGWVYLSHTVWGRETYAVGGNEEAARYSGISVGWTKVRVYAISGLCAGVAGMLTCGYFKSANTATGSGYELNVVAAAVVGGASLLGGRGTALGAVLGMLVIQLIENGNNILSGISLGVATIPVSKLDTRLWLGISIVLAVAVDQLSQHLRNKRLAGARH